MLQLEVATQRMQAFIERKPANPLARILWALLTLVLAGMEISGRLRVGEERGSGERE